MPRVEAADDILTSIECFGRRTLDVHIKWLGTSELGR
jgi:hypothetical protein